MSLSYKVDMVMANPLHEKIESLAGFEGTIQKFEEKKILFSGIYYCRNNEKQ